MDTKNRLVSKGITIKELLVMSYQDYYKKNDNKDKRMRLDIVNAKLTMRKNYEYNRSEQKWEQTGRNAKLVFMVKTRPISYKKKDPLKFHIYPVTFLILDIDKGINSPFKFRTGSLFKPKIPKPGDDKKRREKYLLYNLKNGIQLDFFFCDEWVLSKFGLLYGRNWAAWSPRQTNHRLTPYFDKHSLYIVKKILVRLLGNKKNRSLLISKMWKNK